MFSSKRCDIDHDWFTAGLTFGLCCGLVISYLPQHLRIIQSKSSEGLSPLFLLLGSTSAASALFNILTMQSGLLKCCSVMSLGSCLEISAGIVQLSIQWVCFSFIFVLYMLFYPPHLKYVNQDLQVRTEDTALVVKSRKFSDEWKWSSVFAWIAIVHFVLAAFTTAFVVFTTVPEPGVDAPLPPLAYSWARFLGVSAAILASVQYAPQLLHTYRSKLVGALSIPMMCIQTPGGVLMVLSVALRPGTNWTSWITFAVACVMQGLLLTMCVFWKIRQKRLGIDDFGVPLGQRADIVQVPGLENQVPAVIVTQPLDPISYTIAYPRNCCALSAYSNMTSRGRMADGRHDQRTSWTATTTTMTGFSSLPLEPEEAESGASSNKFKGVARILGPSWAHLPTLTVGLLGVQVFWSVEMSYASPYLLSLGLSKSSMAIVFLAGPLSGLIMQPLIGVLADKSTSRFGRRRPYMLTGAVLCMAGMLLLGFTRPVASLFTTLGSSANDTLTIWLAVLAIFFIDFAINAVQAMDRALLVDTVPSSKQAPGNAWAAKMMGVGAVVGFFVGKLDLTHALPFLGNTQLEVLSVIVSFLLFATHAIMAVFVKERVLLKSGTEGEGRLRNQNAFVREMKSLWSNVRTLPWVIRQICVIQFCAWIAWFPVLFYSSIYVGDFLKESRPTPSTSEAKALLDAEATRMGSRALFYSALISLVCNFVLPLFIAAKKSGLPEAGSARKWLRVPAPLQIHLASLWAFSHLLFACCMLATFFTHSLVGATVLVSLTGFSWAITQWAPFALLAEAILTEPSPATADDGESIQLEDARTRRTEERVGFLSAAHDSDGEDDEDEEEIRKAQDKRRLLLGNHAAHVSSVGVDRMGRESPTRTSDNEFEIVSPSEAYDRPRSARYSRSGGAQDHAVTSPAGGLSAKAGIILGIHNVSIVIPQFLVTGLSSIIFAIFDPHTPSVPLHSGKSPAPVINGTDIFDSMKNASGAIAGRAGAYHLDDLLSRAGSDLPAPRSNSVVYVFRIGGIAATFAFVLCWRLAREMRHR